MNSNQAYLLEWEESMMDKHVNDIWVKNIYWRLDQLSCVLILRNKFWFEGAIPILDDLWKTIEYEKVNGYEHRSPNKKIKLEPKHNSHHSNELTKCCINIYTSIEEEELEKNLKTEHEQHIDNDIDNDINNDIDNDIDNGNIVLNIDTEMLNI